MENFALIDVFRNYCNENDIVFLMGNTFRQNISANAQKYKIDQLVLSADLNVSVSYTIGNSLDRLSYTGIISLGRKFEERTQSEQDETIVQKYDNRLKDLSQIFSTIMKNIACDNELDIDRFDIEYSINRHSANIDFVVAAITLSHRAI